MQQTHPPPEPQRLGLGLRLAVVIFALFPLAYAWLPQPVGSWQARLDLARGRLQLIDFVPPAPLRRSLRPQFIFYPPNRWGWSEVYPDVTVIPIQEIWPNYAAVKYAEGYNQVMLERIPAPSHPSETEGDGPFMPPSDEDNG